MKWFQEMMSESGNVSVTRFVFLIGSLWAMALTTMLILTTEMTAAEIVAVFAGIWGPVAALKFGQKFQEK